ncbi:hypothetical protein PAHAL_8G190000 [Panicum hallii]|uniref:Uncharacterized protein n=1 Tax=Panicum hallii TaxID=206008 RepID=A0A2T8I9H4_9POAL|nr:hypothetical protein PAHAL_8G190000 [Panicum hallii]
MQTFSLILISSVFSPRGARRRHAGGARRVFRQERLREGARNMRRSSPRRRVASSAWQAQRPRTGGAR